MAAQQFGKAAQTGGKASRGHPARVWRSMENRFSDSQWRRWKELCDGQQLHVVISYQNIIITAVEAEPQHRQATAIARSLAELHGAPSALDLMRQYGLLEFEADAPLARRAG